MNKIQKETIQEENQEIYYFSCEASTEEEAKAALLSYLANQTKKEEIKRPDIEGIEVFLGLLCPIIFILLAVYSFISWSFLFKPIYFIVTLLLIVLFFLKPFILLSIKMYQKFAPLQLRKSCRFTPSCSEYMTLAIKKYGVWKGTIKGIRRLAKCHYPNGGKDYP